MIVNNYKPHDNLSITHLYILGNKYPTACLIDSNMTLELRRHRWTATKEGYIRCTIHPNETMHRIVVGAKEGDITDHINGNPSDNRRKNLRIVTHNENMWNRKASSASIIPVKGVYIDKSKWRAEITYNNKKVRLGSFDDIYDAVCARIRKEIELYGDKSVNYKSVLATIPSRYLVFWFPEIYGKQNYKYIGSDFFKAFFIHHSEAKDSTAMRHKLRRYREKARSETRLDIKRHIGQI